MQLKYNGDTGENFVNILNKMAAISQTTRCIRIHFNTATNMINMTLFLIHYRHGKVPSQVQRNPVCSQSLRSNHDRTQ